MANRINPKEYASIILEKVREVMTLDRFKAFLAAPDVLQAFREQVLRQPPYSMGNRLTLALFGARAVAGYRTWQALGYQVRRGSKGIPIHRPIVVTVQQDGKENCEEEGAVARKLIGFDVAFVFDFNQVDPMEGQDSVERRAAVEAFFQARQQQGLCRELEGGSDGLSETLGYWVNSQYPVRFETILNGAKGYTDGREIVVRVEMSPAQTMKTMLHELAHCRLGHLDSPLGKSAREIQAESAAFVAASRLGLDTGPYSFDYLAAWGAEILQAEDGATRFHDILKDAVEQGLAMAEEFSVWRNLLLPVPIAQAQAA